MSQIDDKAYSAEQRLNGLFNALATPIPGDSQNALTLANGWAGHFTYMRIGWGLVAVDFVVTGNASTSLVIGTLPVAYRPAATRYIACGSNTNVSTAGVALYLQIATTGVMTLIGISALGVACTVATGGIYFL